MIVCIASGPSLTAGDCRLVEFSGIRTVAVNHSWKMARFADFIYAGDATWWEQYGDEIDIPAQGWTCSKRASIKFDLKFHNVGGPYNSGMRAVQWAIEQGEKIIILLGYDCSVKNGTHWHGDHDKSKNPNTALCRKWQNQFLRVAMIAKKNKARVINCSRYTEIECFERMTLEEALALRS